MRIKFDPKADALYITLKRTRVHKTVAKPGGYFIDLDRKGSVIGIEILAYAKKSRAMLGQSPVSAHALST